MKNLLTIRYSLVIPAVLLIMFSSCQDNRLVNPIKPSPKLIPNSITTFDGILAFSSLTYFETYMRDSISKIKEERISFENHNKFTSLFTEFENIKLSKSGTTTELIESNNGNYTIKCLNQSIAQLIDKHGFVIIGRGLYIFTDKAVKSVPLSKFTSNELHQLMDLLQNASATNSAKHVFVSKISKTPYRDSKKSSEARTAYNDTPGIYDLPVGGYNNQNINYFTRLEVMWSTYEVTDYGDDTSQNCSYVYDESCNCTTCIYPQIATGQRTVKSLDIYVTGFTNNQVAQNFPGLFYSMDISTHTIPVRNGVPFNYNPDSQIHNSSNSVGIHLWDWDNAEDGETFEVDGSIYYKVGFYNSTYSSIIFIQYTKTF